MNPECKVFSLKNWWQLSTNTCLSSPNREVEKFRNYRILYQEKVYLIFLTLIDSLHSIYAYDINRFNKSQSIYAYDINDGFQQKPGHVKDILTEIPK